MQLTDVTKRSTSAPNITYVLGDNATFFRTGYKVLNGSDRSSLIKCAKYHRDGKIKLLYFSAHYSSIASIRSRLNENNLMHILSNVFTALLTVKENGFLDSNNIDITPETIFVDRTTLSVHLIYLPIYNHSYEDATALLLGRLRASLVRIVEDTPLLATDNIHRIIAGLSGGSTDLQSLAHLCRSLIQRADEGIPTTGDLPPRANGASLLYLTAVGAPADITFTIDCPEFLIGKAAGAVDGFIGYNRAVSRIHCKIVKSNSDYYVVDLGSSNGTFINGRRLIQDTPFKLENGMVLRLANSEFQVTL